MAYNKTSAVGLCDQCYQFAFDILAQKFAPQRWDEKAVLNDRYFAHSQLSDLYQHAQSDCKLCKLMLDFAKDRADELNMSFQQGAVTIRASLKEPDTFWVQMPMKGAPFIMASRLEFYPIQNAGLENVDLPFHLPKPSLTAPVSDHPTDQKVFELVRYWMSECHRNHIVCRQSQLGFSPRRLLDVGSPDSSMPVCLREGIIDHPQYVALSHCWGRNKTGTTTRANLLYRKQQISLAELPATFRDAIVITQTLGIRYIWIDSLCIVQDSSEDWKQNCSEMSAIYSNSMLTIGALWAQSSEHGIFGNRATMYPSNIFRGEVISAFSNRKGDNKNNCYAVGVRVAPWDFEYALNASRLDKRGWVVQERILSPATLYYWTSETYWECRACKASESRPKLIAHGDGYMKGVLHQIQRDRITQHPSGHYTAWYLLVEIYTRKELTYLSDKYPAILGLIIEFRKQFSVKDISGIWEEDFHRGILWQRWVYDNERLLKTTGYPDAPSWSWLAVDFPVVFAWIPSIGGMTSFYPTVRELAVSDADIVNIGRLAVDVGTPNSVKAYCKIYADVVPVCCTAVRSTDTRGLRGWSVIQPRKTQEVLSTQLFFVPDWDFDIIDRAYCVKIASWQHVQDTWKWQGLTNTSQPVFTYYLVIQRTKDTRPFRSKLDIGTFNRIGIGAASTLEVDSFFTHSSRRLLKLL